MYIQASLYHKINLFWVILWVNLPFCVFSHLYKTYFLHTRRSQQNKYLSSVRIFGGVVASSNTQHVFSTVVKLGEAIELAVGKFNGRLIDSIERCVGVIGVVEEWLEQHATTVKVSRTTQVNLLVLWTHLILDVLRKAGVKDGGVRALTEMLTQEPGDMRMRSV